MLLLLGVDQNSPEQLCMWPWACAGTAEQGWAEPAACGSPGELEAEVDLLKQFDHPNIVRYLVRSWQLPVVVGSSRALLRAIALGQPAAAKCLHEIAAASDCTPQAHAWLHECAALQPSHLHEIWATEGLQ